MPRFGNMHLVLTLFDGSHLVLRERMVHLRAAEGWVPTGALARPRAPLPRPERASASLALFAGGELRATVHRFEAVTSPLGGLELSYRARGVEDPAVRLRILARRRGHDAFEGFVHAMLDDAFVRDVLSRGQDAV